MTFEKVFVAILLLSMIPGFIWGWKDTRHEALPTRIFMAFVGALVPPTAIATITIIVAVIVGALLFLFS